MLNGTDQAINARDENVGVLAHQDRRQILVQGGLEHGPLPLDLLKTFPAILRIRHKQRSLRIPAAQAGQHLLEIADIARKTARVPRRLGQRHAIAQHAHAARLVDGAGSALQLPGHPDGESYGSQRNDQEAGLDER